MTKPNPQFDSTDESPSEQGEGESQGGTHRRIRNLISRLPGAVYRCTYDKKWISLYMGEGFEEICGIQPETLDPAGRSFRDIVLPEDLDPLRETVAEAVAERTYYSVEYRIRTDDGDVRWVEDNGRPSFRDDGSVRWLDGILIDITGRKEAEQALRKMNETLEDTVRARTRQLRRLSAELAMAEQREREQLARMVHNDLQQFLYGVQVKTKMLIDSIKRQPDVDVSRLSVQPRELEQLLQEAIDTTRGLTVNLSPPVLSGDGLTETLQWLKSHFRKTENLEVSMQGDVPEESLPKEVRMVLFQAVRELLMNVSQHSGADTACVSVFQKDDHLYVRVADEGIGFNVDDELDRDQSSFGLHSVAERIRFFDGSLRIDTQPGEGTTCTLKIPMDIETSLPASESGLPPALQTGTAIPEE